MPSGVYIRNPILRPQTFKRCEACGISFGPISHLSRKFCSVACSVASKKTGRLIERRTIPKARSAQSLLRYHIQSGHIVRPIACEECGGDSKPIEGAHFNYDEPLRVRWLCRSCHVRWDRREPKGGTYAVKRRENLTGKKAKRERGAEA